MEFWQAYSIVRRRWLLIIGLILLSTTVAFAVVKLKKPVYLATTTINTGIAQSADWYSTNVRLADMQEVLVSRYLLTELDNQVKLNKPIDEIEKAITVSRVRDSGVLRIDVRWSDPVKARDAANTLDALFIGYENGQIKLYAQQGLTVLDNQLKLATDRLDRAQASVPKGQATDPNVRGAQEELVAARQGLADTVTKLEAAQAAANNPNASSSMVVIDQAIAPPKAESNNLARTLVFGVLLGALLGVFLAVGAEYLNSGTRLLATLQQELGAPILAAIPWQRRFRGEAFPALARVDSSRREAFRALRTSLLVHRRDLGTRVDGRADGRRRYLPTTLLVVAESPASGCTSVIAHLGSSLASVGQRVLIVDTNLSAPALHRFLHRPATPGITDWLDDPRRDLDVLVQETDVPNLSLLASGRLHPAASDLLVGQGIGQLVETLGQSFDTVILDSPPLARSGDARLLSESADEIIVVLRPNGNRDEDRARQLVQFAGEKLLGVVLYGADPDMAPVAGRGPAILSADGDQLRAAVSSSHETRW